MIGTRLTPKVVKEFSTLNKGDRSTSIVAIALHSTESHDIPDSAADLFGVASWLCNPAADASAHVVVDGDGQSVRIVPDEKKAWACSNYNSPTLNIEQVGWASYGKLNWIKKERELNETARWIAHWSLKHDIPIKKAHVLGPYTLSPGIVMHKDLGQSGGSHVDPGEYPFDKVLDKADKIKSKLLKQRRN